MDASRISLAVSFPVTFRCVHLSISYSSLSSSAYFAIGLTSLDAEICGDGQNKRLQSGGADSSGDWSVNTPHREHFRARAALGLTAWFLMKLHSHIERLRTVKIVGIRCLDHQAIRQG